MHPSAKIVILMCSKLGETHPAAATRSISS